VDFLLPANVSRFLPSDLRQAVYYKFNYTDLAFQDYRDTSNSPLYQYILTDSDNDGKRDNNELVTLRLTLTDGDQWDGDRTVNGIIVDPGAPGFQPNQAPTALTLTNPVTSLAENTDTTERIQLADLVISDDGFGTNTVSLSGDDADAFEIDNNRLFLRAGIALDFEAKASYNISINVADPELTSSTPISTPFQLTLTNVNETPTVATPIKDQKATGNTAFTFAIPSDTFKDVDTNDALVFSASLSNGSPLPAWLRFNAETKTFSGTPANADAGSISVKITATDTQGASAEDTFTLSIEARNTQPTLTPQGDAKATRFILTPATGDATERLIVDGNTLPSGAQPVFEVQGGVTNRAPIAVSFENIQESTTPIDLSATTEGGGTIQSNAPSGIGTIFNGVYLNFAAGNDDIIGSSFNDFIRAGAGDDLINAGAGNDLIRSGAGNDTITTGDGADFIYYTADQLDGTADRVLDFSTADRIVLGENIRASLNGNIATFATTINGVDRQATLIFDGSSVVFDNMFITSA
jgi:hypothetical protein